MAGERTPANSPSTTVAVASVPSMAGSVTAGRDMCCSPPAFVSRRFRQHDPELELQGIKRERLFAERVFRVRYAVSGRHEVELTALQRDVAVE